MAEMEQGKSPRSQHSEPTTPEEYLTTGSSRFPSGDYSYTVELVGTIQNSLGRLTESVDALKELSKEHGREIGDLKKDIHAAKTTLKVVGVVVAALLTFAGWAINKGVDAIIQMNQQPPAIESSAPPAQR